LPLARVTASNSLDERSAPIKPTPRRPKSPTVPSQANIFRGALRSALESKYMYLDLWMFQVMSNLVA
ncbi:MAG: hypothetical protein ACR2KT_09105, partial [Methylocella sp.]